MGIFLNFSHYLKKLCFMYILMYFCQKPGCGASLPTPPFAWFYRNYRPPKGGRSPSGRWSAVRHGTSQDSNQFPVPGRVECRVGGFSVGLALLLFLSAPLAAHQSRQVSETGILYRAVMHHTHFPLHRSLAISLKARSNITSPGP